MTFNSIIFLLFLACVYALYIVLRPRPQNALLLASYIFYGWWDWRFLGLIIFTSTLDPNWKVPLDPREYDKGKKRLILNVCLKGRP